MYIFTNSQYEVYIKFINNLYQCQDLLEFTQIINEYINQLIPTDSYILLLYENDGITAKSCFVNNLDDKSFSDYLNYYQNVDLYKNVIHQLDEPPIVNRASDYLNYNEWEKNEHRINFLLPQNIYHICCMEIIHKNKIIASLSLHRNNNHKDFNNKEIEMLKLLAPIIKNIYLAFQKNKHEIIYKNLTPREKQIFPMLIKNYSTTELSSYFSISKNTIKTHVRHILRKTNCSSRFELILKLQKMDNDSNE